MTNTEWERARVIRTPEGILCRDPHSGWWIDEQGGQWGTSDIDAMAWVAVVIDADEVNQEAEDRAEKIAELRADLARLVRERETALRGERDAVRRLGEEAATLSRLRSKYDTLTKSHRAACERVTQLEGGRS